MRDGVENPAALARAQIVAADVSWRCRPRALFGARGHNQDVVTDRPRRSGHDGERRSVAINILLQIDAAALSEGLDDLASLRVQAPDARLDGREDAFVGAVLPIGEPAR